MMHRLPTAYLDIVLPKRGADGAARAPRNPELLQRDFDRRGCRSSRDRHRSLR